MKKKFDHVYQFKIELKDTRPPIWRRIQVPETYTFWDLHVAIQDVMGWLDYHLHQFDIVNLSTEIKTEIGIPDEEFERDRDILPGWEQKIAGWFTVNNRLADYMYDFGDDWEHAVEFEEVLSRDRNIKYPICVDGQRACPPEDCGGVWGYEEICRGESEFQEEYSDFDPESFDAKEVIFDDPDERLKILLDDIL